MQRNNTPVMLIAIVLGVLALGATAFLLLRQPPGPAPGGVAAAPTPTPAPVGRYVAIKNIPPRTVIDSTMLRQDFKPGAVPAGAITSPDDVSGELTSEPINAGETVLMSSFAPRVRRQVKANIPIPTGLRGVAIWVDPAQTAAGLVDVGDRVDVISTHRLSYDKAPRQYIVGALNFTTGRTIAENVLVLAVDDSISAPSPTPTPLPGAPAAPAGAPTPAPPPAPPQAGPTRKRVLLAATPDVAARLVAANDQGTLHITIRNPTDGDTAVVPEAHEYPSRIFTAPKETTAGASSGNGSGETRNLPKMGPIPTLPPPATPIPTPPMMMPTPVPTMSPEVIAAANSKEITVIRGTEKTRVIVPQR